MPRILVADDNSNIHRTVAQALKEAGVDVVAVGNGEAAVRKIAEIKPDLVLADIFMPVRNGYEVCEFVKKDPRFSHIPVVLLIGAFDPFDEREAQRVQADAILKKPFVPADSLLRTVSDLLAQVAARSPATPAAASPAPAARQAAPAPARQAPATEFMDQPPEEIAPTKARLQWDSNEQPLAFGTLLENPGGAAADDTVMTARRDPNLGEPGFWAPTPKAEPEVDGDESEAGDPQAASATGSIAEEWNTGTALVELDDLDKPPAETESVSRAAVPKLPIDLDEASLELPELILPTERSEETPSETSQSKTPARPEAALLKVAQPKDEDDFPELDSFPAPVIEAETPQGPVSTSKPSVAEAKIDRTTPAEAPAIKIADEPEFLQELGSESSEEDETHPIEAGSPGLVTLAPFLASLTSAASARTADAEESFDFGAIPELSAAIEHEVEHSEDVAESESAEAAGQPAAWRLDPELVEAIAQRVIERMQPQLIELVTRELLRPAVEALVQRELERK